jgi:hypothetical protein
MTDGNEFILRELKVRNTSLWKMIILHRISINPVKALAVKYLDSDLVGYGLKHLSGVLFRNFSTMTDDEKNDAFITVTALIMYGGYRVSPEPIVVLLPVYVSLISDMIDNESLKPVLEKSIWEYYRTWVFNARDFYSEEERIRMEIEHLIKDQNSIKDI